MRGLFLFSPSALDYGQRLLFMTPAQIWWHERKSRVNQFAKADTLDCDHQSQNVLGIGPLKTPYPIALIIRVFGKSCGCFWQLQSAGSMHVSTLSRRYSWSRRP